MPSIFERKEKKYLLTRTQFETLMSKVRHLLVEEQYHKYKICNIYYDTAQFDLFRKSSEKPEYKEKLRLRSYGTPKPGDTVFLEVKKKYKGIVYKRRIDLPIEHVYDFIDYQSLREPSDSINQREIEVFLGRYNLLPQVYLSYDREAYLWGTDSDFRLTFDTNIKYRLEDVFLELGDEGEYILDDGMVLMEVKCRDSLPMEFVSVLSEIEAFNISFSKIGTVYKKVIIPEVILKPQPVKEPEWIYRPASIVQPKKQEKPKFVLKSVS